MVSVEPQVKRADSVICQDIARPVCDRGFLSRNVLGQLRNLVEGGSSCGRSKIAQRRLTTLRSGQDRWSRIQHPYDDCSFVLSPREENVGCPCLVEGLCSLPDRLRGEPGETVPGQHDRERRMVILGAGEKLRFTGFVCVPPVDA